MKTNLVEVDRVEVLTIADNYIDILVQDQSEVVTRAAPLEGMDFKKSILAEHGFSAVLTTTVEGYSQSLLFDFGFSSNAAAQNADALGVDMSQIGALALSHGHLDHCGGLVALAGKLPRKGIELTAHPAIFRSPRYIKIAEGFLVNLPALERETISQAGLELGLTREPKPLLDNTVLFLGEIPRVTDYERGMPKFCYEENGQEKQDDFIDDTGVVVNVRDKGLVILSGCAHSGIVNTVKQAIATTGVEQILAVMGGFHLAGEEMEPAIEPTVNDLIETGTKYVIPTHCTGRDAMGYIERAMPEQFILNMSGTKMTF
jgi:7,8-dihydropterin-6-yl-methyl-4-(beta-D-ribofuranosyl)aminobenzene 5'-phosphate synthase